MAGLPINLQEFAAKAEKRLAALEAKPAAVAEELTTPAVEAAIKPLTDQFEARIKNLEGLVDALEAKLAAPKV